jgi:hypothetical protein
MGIVYDPRVFMFIFCIHEIEASTFISSLWHLVRTKKYTLENYFHKLKRLGILLFFSFKSLKISDFGKMWTEIGEAYVQQWTVVG